ncbi:hypothetical protein EGH21_19565 [Halomicroarcula sp. F13]|uniref:Coil containing protein n=1 Tax=Haloarcula rubra TaxID=2487747 RepID=A0AAW4PY38_9EURY|nr:hypothetical protein [Halomicroarcula rubra]MBX0325228.1 hypothetical protein [Halomicroarcula rubra]
MPQTYTNFDAIEQDGQHYIVATPKSEHEEPVRFSGDLEETEGLDATFRDVIKSLIQQDLSDALNLEADTGGTISREEAIRTLANAEESPVTVQSEQQAEAIIDYFIDNGILKEEGSEVVVLSDPESLADIAAEGGDSEEDSAMLLNWMSAIEGCTTKIQETIDTVEEVEDELREQMGQIDVSQKMEEYEHKQKEVAQRIMNLTNGGQLDKSDLSNSEQAEYERLEHRLFHLESMIDSVSSGSDLDQEIQKMTNELSMHVQNLSDTQGSLEVQLERLRKVYQVNEHINYEDAKEMAEHLSSVASAVAGVADAAERKEDGDAISLASSVVEEMGKSESITQDTGPDVESAGQEQGL